MPSSECSMLISEHRVARLGCCRDNQPYVVPIYYVRAEDQIFSFSMPGRKIEFMRSNPFVCIEIEHFADQHRWRCVVIEGRYREFHEDAEKKHAWGILNVYNDWWEPGALNWGAEEKPSGYLPIFFAISMDKVTGREALAN
ncbi:pyridoxamine 5'-phosphate oxidase family protein [Rhizobium mongolense]|nr:pyridoxamine 5'-phosphate oxidase family protein [Rhizobium sp. CC1099]WFU90250.1 pyridoxamine 5'-phosphate oxidase family protein [Rhizobium sp. CC1099]